MSCIYTYKNHTFNSESELDDFLREKFGYESKFGDIIFDRNFDRKNNFLRTKNIIENGIIKDSAKLNLQMKIRNARRRAAYYDGEEVLNFDPPYIGVNRFLQGLEHNGKRLHPEFIPENYWNKRKESWTDPLKPEEKIKDRFSEDEINIFFDGSTFEEKLSKARLLNESECKQLEELMTKKWEYQAAAGTAVHYILEQYFTKDKDSLIGDMSRDEIFARIKSTIDKDLEEEFGSSKYKQFKGTLFNDKIIYQAIDYADDLKSIFRKKYGENCEFYPEISVSSKLADPNAKPDTLLGIVDLLVVDESGQIHYFDYKTSPKPYDKFNDVKKKAYQYQLGMYGKLLKRYHLNYRKSDISILPIQFENLDLINPEDAHKKPSKALFSYTGIKPKEGLFENDTRNKIFEVNPSGEEKILDILDDYIPEELVYDVASEKLLSSIEEQNKTWFPDYTKYKAKSEEEIKQLIKDEKIEPVEKEGKQVWAYQPKGVNSKEIIANSEAELIEKIKKQQERNEKRGEYFANIVERAVQYGIDNSTTDIGGMLASIDTKQLQTPTASAKWFTEKLGVYCNGNWQLVKIDALKGLGILCFKNIKTNQIDIVKLTSASVLYNPFETSIKNGKRVKSRNHLISYAFQSDITETSNSSSLMLDGHKGNIEIMEVVQALNNIPGLCESGAVIGNIQVINPYQGNGISASNEEILYSFKRMCQLSPLKTKNNILDGTVKFASTFDLGVNSFNEAMETPLGYEIDNTQFNSAKSELDKAIEESDNEEKVNAIQKIINLLEKAHPDLVKGRITREMLLTKPYARLYNELLQAQRYLRGINFRQQIKNHDKYSEERTFKGIVTKGLAGTYIDNPGNMLSDTLNTVAKLVSQAYQNIRNTMGSKVAQIREATEELKKYKGFIGVSQMVGNATDMYEHMTEVVNGDLLFTDINSSKLSTAERKYLKLILEIINENRFGGKKSKKELEQMRDSHNIEYYRVPLCVASAESQDSIVGLQKGLKERLDRFHPKKALARIRAEVDGLFMEEDAESYKNATGLFEMNNKFDKSEGSVDYRIDSITKHGAGYFERNLEVLAFKHCYAYTSAKELNKVFPTIKAAMSFLSNAGNTVNETFEDDTQYLENYIKNSVKGQPIQTNEKMAEATALSNKIRRAASFFALAFSPVQGAYQTIQGLWQDISLIIRKPNGDPAFTVKNMYDAAKEVYKDLFHSSDSPTKCQLINEWLGVNDMDMNIYADRMRTDQHNKYNFVNFAYKFASRPDFYNRMTIIVAKMKADGIWDALKVEDGKLVYDFKKDKRFEQYVQGNTLHSDYNNQRALYYTIAQQFVKEEAVYQNGNIFQLPKDLSKPTQLPYAWTNQEAESIKSLCDLIYGYYSHEKKSLIHATFLGSLFMQMKTYWSGKKNQYLQPGGVRIQGKWEQATDPETKKPLYYQVNSDGIIDYDAPLTITPTSAPFYQWKGQFQEGIILTISNIFKNGILSKEGLKQGWEETWNNEDINIRTARRANLKQFVSDLTFYLVIGMGIAGMLMADWDKELKKEAKESGKLSDALAATLVHLTRLSFGQSAEDFNWWVSIGNPAVEWSPFAITQGKNMTKRFWNSLFGDTSFYDGVTKSFAAGKQMQPIIDWLNPKNF